MGSGMLLLVLAALVAVAAADPPPPEVEVNTGRLRGKWLSSWGGRPIAGFEGVPYAQPPVGPLRFKDPVPAAPWSGVRPADSFGSVCPQIDVFLKSEPTGPVGSEDCLFLNVYAPETTSRSKPLPVMVYIHGGGYVFGSGDTHGPEMLLDKDVLLVNFNYRLGTLGFPSTGDGVISGNFGMKDMVLALQWVRDNIRAFGGDPNRVTIFGESAGGAAVHLLMLSKLSKGLFHGAVAMSGNALSPWAYHSSAQAAQNTAKLAELVNCPSASSEDIKQCLLSKKAEELVATDKHFPEWQMYPMLPFRVTAEPSGPGAFLDRHPSEVYAAGEAADVPFMTGFTSNEGCLFSVPLLEDSQVTSELNERFLDLAPIIFSTKDREPDFNRKLYKQIRDFYFRDKAISKETGSSLTDLFSDTAFIVSVLETAKMQEKSSKSPVFLYEVAHRSERSWSTLFGAKDSYGVCHADDLLYLFPLKKWFQQELSQSDKAFATFMVDLFTTFASTGRPTTNGSWKEVQDGDHAEYALLEQAGRTEMRKDFAPERVAFWREKVAVNLGLAPNSASQTGRDEL